MKARNKAQAPSVRSVVDWLQTCLYYVDNKSTKWHLSLTVKKCANTWQLSVCVAMCYRPTLIACRRLHSACNRMWSILHDAASRGPSELADILVILATNLVNMEYEGNILQDAMFPAWVLSSTYSRSFWQWRMSLLSAVMCLLAKNMHNLSEKRSFRVFSFTRYCRNIRQVTWENKASFDCLLPPVQFMPKKYKNWFCTACQNNTASQRC